MGLMSTLGGLLVTADHLRRLSIRFKSATGWTRCGEFVDQKDEGKPIGRDQRPETSGGKMEERRFPTSSV